MKQEWQGDRYVWLADSLEEIKSAGWVVFTFEDWKHGVARVRCTKEIGKGTEMREVFVRSSNCDGTGALVV